MLRIHEPEVVEIGEFVRVSARVETDDPELADLDRLWFEVDGRYRDVVGDDADPFVVALLPLGMASRSDIEVLGRVSPRLAYGVEEYQRVVHAWWPVNTQLVTLHHRALDDVAGRRRGDGVGCTFSGGVDSFYSLWRHLPNNEPNPSFRITHAIMINGFDHDTDLDDEGLFPALVGIYGPLMDELGVELVVVRTNLQAFRDVAVRRAHARTGGTGRHANQRSFGTALAAAGLLLGGLFARVYIPGSVDYAALHPDGAHPMIDHLLSTERTETIHDGADVKRVDKTAVLAQWPATYSRLRVCRTEGWTSVDTATGTVDNCCVCPKCVRTMTTLDLNGALSRFESFPRPLRRTNVRFAHDTLPASLAFERENFELALAKRRWDVALDVGRSLVRNHLVRAVGGLRARLRS